MNRRSFLIKSSSTVLAAAPFAALAEQIQPGHPHSTKLGWQISVQHRTPSDPGPSAGREPKGMKKEIPSNYCSRCPVPS